MDRGLVAIRAAYRAATVLLVALATLFAAVQVRGETAASAPASGALSSSPLNAIKGLFGSSKSEPELLEPDKAFQLAVAARDSNTLVAKLTPAPNYYLYRDRISFRVLQPASLKVERVTFPMGQRKEDPNFGSVEVFKEPFEAVLALKETESGGAPDTLQLQASYQGCNEPLGVCYPPIEKTVTVSLAVGGTSAPEPSSARTDSRAVQDFDDKQIRDVFFKGSTWALVAAFFGFGLLLAFTPCMLPMIPILSGIIIGSRQHASRRQMLLLSCAYVFGMAITYAAAGVAAGLAGTLLSTYLQNPWVLGGFAAVFVLLALSMFGLYELQLPASFQSRLAAAGSRLPGGRLLGVFGMGVLSAVIVGPCVAAPLAGALLYIGQTRDVVLGGAALFTMAIGMGVPLLVLAATAGALLPRAGPWMVGVNRVFGVLMLAVAAYMLTPVLPVAVQQLVWAALLIVPAIYLHAADPLPPDAPGHRRLFKGVGVLALVFGIAMVVGALSGNRDILQPLSGLRATSSPNRSELQFTPVRSVAELEQRLQDARGRPVMLDFWAEWCVSCLEMDRFTFSDPRVQSRLKDVILLRADVTANTDDHRALLRRFSLFGPPGIIFFDVQGAELPLRVIGYQRPEQFLATLQRVSAH